MSTPRLGRLAIIGAGLIGSSIARAAREKGLADMVVVGDTSLTVRERVRELGFADMVAATSADGGSGRGHGDRLRARGCLGRRGAGDRAVLKRVPSYRMWAR